MILFMDSAVFTDGQTGTPGPPAKKENAQRGKETRSAAHGAGLFCCTAGRHGTDTRILFHHAPTAFPLFAGILSYLPDRCQRGLLLYHAKNIRKTIHALAIRIRVCYALINR
jgi:hypothetical protein